MPFLENRKNALILEKGPDCVHRSIQNAILM